MKSDVVILGAGIVGVSIALHLQTRGRSVMLVDRRGAGEETSYGNAGLIERSSVVPYAFPRQLMDLIRYGLNTSSALHYQPGFLPQIAPWLFQYWRHSSPRGLAEATAAMLPLIERSVVEHKDLMGDAGVAGLARDTGWMAVYRTARAWEEAIAAAEVLKPYKLSFDVLDVAGLAEREPHLRGLRGAIHWLDPVTVSDPGAVTKGYADLFMRRGGRLITGDARSLAVSGDGWSVQTSSGVLTARNAVVALGAWSSDIFRPLGYRIPLAVKRGYHLHFGAAGNAVLHHPIIDPKAGFALAPMTRGLRLTTGVEFAPRDSAPTPVQIVRSEPLARDIFPIDQPVEAQPWLGNRPALPDMRPVIGRAPRHDRLWFAFGHAHHGFTLGPVTGRLLAEMMVGEATCVDPAPYRVDRF
jgi:D-amino-acid dehydrogenase